MAIDELKLRLDKFSFDHISLGYSEINLVRSDNFNKNQLGYRTNGTASLIGMNGEWQAEWWVIAWDDLGDPIFVDINTDRVYTAMHGEGSWEPTCIADSLDSYERIVNELHNISVGRENPVRMENNPIYIQTKEMFTDLVTKNNVNSEPWYWKLIIGDEV